MAGRALLAGYRREPGFARGYIGPDGKRISYRQYRNLVEAANLVTRLGPVELAESRRRQRAFNDIINQMSKVEARAIDQRIELLEHMGAPPDEIKALRKQRKIVKSRAIKGTARKEALRDLELYHHKSDDESQRRTVQALVTLGRRENIDDWVPPGMSEDFRRGFLTFDKGVVYNSRTQRTSRGVFDTRASK